ncbi:DUF4263 domain-containing protein [Neobacillus piezotolerans]|uniref:DUF4263 domain-containing protein n=1 Tax=Neobacillus piezotolerans TaxID=2259171 RepID=A0A3D8GW47_9BACI|nr:Shedu immune nuclease family protein [Neobacillus piezotolerans]RDU38683.1 DUF4263 domain-containing protein [Neobacillus piezotolerans]
MKQFLPLSFDPQKVQEELELFGKLLAENPELDEKKHILPFFNKNINLSNFIGIIDANMNFPNKYAFEFDIFGDFKSDLVIGDSTNNNYLFIEFENAKSNSIFKKNGNKATLEWSYRFEHGYSQIIDWFWKLNDFRQSGSFRTIYGSDLSNFNGLLVIGRTAFIAPLEQQRLNWRKNYVQVNSKSILCMTYDELYEILKIKLNFAKILGQITD